MVKASKRKAPPRPECGSIEQNAMIIAINKGKKNPCPDSEACTKFWNSLIEQKKEDPSIYFSCVETDAYEDYVFEQMAPLGLFDLK